MHFIPPGLIKKVLDKAEETHVHGSPKDEKLKKGYNEYPEQKLGKK